jgi:8-oxo-dGTP pyrophosphatase MutT (NUDIX family)
MIFFLFSMELSQFHDLSREFERLTWIDLSFLFKLDIFFRI